MLERNRFIDILKAVCMVFVIITHDTISEWFRLRALFNFWIDMAVPLFMIISGYVYAASFERNKILRIGQAYTARFLVPKFVRYTVPFIMAFFVEVVAEVVVRHNCSLKSWLWQLFEGGWGPGSYYYPLLLQFLLVYPVIYFLVRRFGIRGVVLCFILTGGFEFCKTVWHCNGQFYRLLLFRYVFVISFGSWIWQYKDERLRPAWNAALVLAGVAFIIVYRYLHVRPRILIYWTNTSFIACLYLVPLAAFLLRRVHLSCAPLELIGRASYNIFLAQMVYFEYMGAFMQKAVGIHALWLCAHVGICVVAGILFYLIEQRITRLVLASAETVLLTLEARE